MAFSIIVVIYLLAQILGTSRVNTNFKTTDMEEKELLAIDELRLRMNDSLYKDYMKSEKYLVRWLNATDFNVPKAEKMLRTGLKWRLDNQIDEIVDANVPEGKQAMCFMNGTDYEGSPVATVITSRWNTRAFLYTGKTKVQILAFAKCLEAIQTAVLERIALVGDKMSQRSPMDKALMIIDLEGYSLKLHACFNCFSVYAEWSTILEDYYPGLFKQLVYLNAPRAVNPLMEFSKPLMSKQTSEILKIFGQNKTEWKEYLRKIIPENQLSLTYGGS